MVSSRRGQRGDTSLNRRVIALLVVLLVTILAAGCATPAAPRGPDPTAFPTNAVVKLRDSIPATFAEETVDFEFDAIVTGSSTIRYGTSYGGRGVSTLGGKNSLEMIADFSELGLGELDIILDDDRAYLHGGFLEDLVRPREWVLIDGDSDDPDVATLADAVGRAGDVSIVVYFLYGETGPVAQRPPQTLRGTPADRFAVTLDLELAADKAPADVAESLQGYIEDLGTAGVERTLDSEVWVQEGLIRRVILTYRYKMSKGGGQQRITYDFLDFGDPVEPTLPAQRDIVRIEDILP
jgi:hypothetical protein